MLLLIFVVTALLAPVCAAQAETINDQMRFGVSSGSAKGATDDLITTAWAPRKAGEELNMKFPKGGAGYIRIDWSEDSSGFAFIQYDASGNEIAACTEKDTYPAIMHLFPIMQDARYATLRLTTAGQQICSVRVYSVGALPDDVPNFDPPCTKCDLMIVSTHQDDELLFFGGIIPYYNAVQHKKVQVVYMANCGRLRRGEALNGLWAADEKNYPDFINLKDKRVETIREGVKLWGGKRAILSALVTRIRRYQPEVILTHDLDGEYGHNQHKITANAMKMAIEAAADPAQYPDSYAKYGAWQVKKLYLHLYSENVIDFDWDAAYPELGGQTPLQLARAGYAKHVSQQKYYKLRDGGEYDNSLFGLAYTVVGQDVRHDDLFENIDADVMLTAAPTSTPTLAPTSTPTSVPLASPQSTLSAPVTPQTRASTGYLELILGGCVIACAILIPAVILRRKKGERRKDFDAQ